MRTTLTIDDDVAVQLERLRRDRNSSFKQVVNELLRAGLENVKKPKRSTTVRTKTVGLGRCLIGNVDDIAEALALTEGDDFR